MLFKDNNNIIARQRIFIKFSIYTEYIWDWDLNKSYLFLYFFVIYSKQGIYIAHLALSFQPKNVYILLYFVMEPSSILEHFVASFDLKTGQVGYEKNKGLL